MCGICGFYILDHQEDIFPDVMKRLSQIMTRTNERGRTSYGFVSFDGKRMKQKKVVGEYSGELFDSSFSGFCGIVNFRGEPTTEIGHIKDDLEIQPFVLDDWAVTHNGIISNDVEILKDGKIVKKIHERYPDRKFSKLIDSYAILELAQNDRINLKDIPYFLKGSHAFALISPLGLMMLSRDYRGLFFCIEKIKCKDVFFFASREEYLRGHWLDNIHELPIDSHIFVFNHGISFPKKNHGIQNNQKRCCVICSGGLDSTTVATYAVQNNKVIHLIHFQYGCLAEKMEFEAISNIRDFLKVKYPEKQIELFCIDLDFLKRLGGSSLTDVNFDDVAKYDEGVETPHEWVPARNMIMMSMTAAHCDRYDIGKIYLGLNMEEGSVYSDNSISFARAMESAMKTGTHAKPTIENPLETKMKHEIYKMALDIEAPIQFSWSCYKGGSYHCGECGPCVMRKVAAKMNGVEDNIKYLV